MVQTKPVYVEVSIEGQNGCLDEIDINNSCRRVYLRRIESIEKCKRSVTPVVKQTAIGSALTRLREEMVGLMDQDAGLMKQMLILNEKVEELKANNFCQMSKESLDSRDSLYEVEGETDKCIMESEDSLYQTDEEDPGGFLSDEVNYSVFGTYDCGYSDSDEDMPKSISASLESANTEEVVDLFKKLLNFDSD
ncbi:uncharacterized protein [Argopecten irradians]|uniref:uncharacterized protein n=1 Tax=Argopecten irradians TaxID=31199 RepID=UPI00371BEB4A